MQTEINIYILENAIRQAPKSWLKIPNINHYFQKYNRLPLVNASQHQKYLKKIQREFRYDRPDILHFGLLTCLGYAKIYPQINIFFDLKDELYKIDNNTRLPRDQNRFYGLIETILIEEYKGDLIHKIGFSDKFQKAPKVLFTKSGGNTQDIKQNFSNFIFGGFATGSFSKKYTNAVEYSLSEESLELWTAINLGMQKLIC